MSPNDTLKRLPLTSVALRRWGLCCLGAALALLLLLKALPYSSVRLVPVEAAQVAMRPTPDFAVGPLSWPVTALAKASELQPFREAMRTTCGDARGLAAAACATTALSKRTPLGNPATEFVNVDFDPVAHFKRHMAGAPGHCLTRSAILATQLLSVGIPARVVQMVSARASGHTLVEVWDHASGWTLVDPLTGGSITGAVRPRSAVELLADPAGATWKAVGSEPISADKSGAYTHHFQSLLTGNLLYPEPWLYLRLGKRVAPWPFRGHYARVGPALLALGPAQQALTGAIPILALAGLALLACAFRLRVATSHPARSSRVHSVVEARRVDVLPRA